MADRLSFDAIFQKSIKREGATELLEWLHSTDFFDFTRAIAVDFRNTASMCTTSLFR